ncbi:MAG: hypothetical protein B9S34_10445 [Opitutia bacterium Tous-C1TDCM]|nr:MAG: hypothetical protein B9S34_10445 [Opitutae bacterium Tous-C1TDCM]
MRAVTSGFAPPGRTPPRPGGPPWGPGAPPGPPGPPRPPNIMPATGPPPAPLVRRISCTLAMRSEISFHSSSSVISSRSRIAVSMRACISCGDIWRRSVPASAGRRRRPASSPAAGVWAERLAAETKTPARTNAVRAVQTGSKKRTGEEIIGVAE